MEESKAEGHSFREFSIDQCIQKLHLGELLPAHDLTYACSRVNQLLLKESNIRAVASPVTIVGDLRGQFLDLLEVFDISGPCPDTNYIFLGLSAGYSVETISLLVCLKLRYPDRITLLRGQHESRASRNMNAAANALASSSVAESASSYAAAAAATLAANAAAAIAGAAEGGLYRDCLMRYQTTAAASEVWHALTDLFDHLPLAALVDGRVLVLHSGISPSIANLDQLRVLNRFQELPQDGPLFDLVTAEPAETPGFGLVQNASGYVYTFGKDVVDRFCQTNNLDCIVRSHQPISAGHQTAWDKFITVFSAPSALADSGLPEGADQVHTDARPDGTVTSQLESKVGPVTGKEKGPAPTASGSDAAAAAGGKPQGAVLNIGEHKQSAFYNVFSALAISRVQNNFVNSKVFSVFSAPVASEQRTLKPPQVWVSPIDAESRGREADKERRRRRERRHKRLEDMKVREENE